MTDQYRAAPELWAAAEKWGTNTMDMVNCILELRSRIELLEATQHLHFDTSMEMPKQLAPMTDLSPAAQAVRHALYEGWQEWTPEQCLAAALRILAVRINNTGAILAIAAELERNV